MDKVDIAAGKAFDAKLRFDCLGMRNTSGLDIKEKRELDIQYAGAKAEMLRAELDLDTAIRASLRS